ncbi:hypothetical protein SLS56_005759 [Neofusicoccum ribis]|uniref:Non-haem dioxygenase N-terminal domain-containing protein n=1 Tax=Neofusicoccum ribis TaxID=45134 RepID=A0ABR3STC4_9PEZI
MFELSRAFFQSPREVKAECPYQKGKNQGWVGMHAETLDPKSQKVDLSSTGLRRTCLEPRICLSRVVAQSQPIPPPS